MVCWIRGCTTKGGKKSTKKSLFTAHTEEMFNNWCKSGIAIKGINEFNKKSRICELHFQKDDVLRKDIVDMADDSTITVERKVPKLREGAIPSIFPSVSSRSKEISYCYENFINEEKEKEEQNERSSISHLKNTVNCSISMPDKDSDNSFLWNESVSMPNEDSNNLLLHNEEDSVPGEDSDNLLLHNEQGCLANTDNNKIQTWPELSDNLRSLTLPSEYWMPVITDKMAMWAYWSTDLSSRIWRVILEKNMTLRVSTYH